jgi:flagellar motor switch protein FliN/FliY
MTDTPDMSAHNAAASTPANKPYAPNDPSSSRTRLERVLSLELPIVVRLGSRQMTVAEVTSWAPGAIIELPKQADAELEILVNNKVVGCGHAVKLGENFGLRLTYLGELESRQEGTREPSEPDVLASVGEAGSGERRVAG